MLAIINHHVLCAALLVLVVVQLHSCYKTLNSECQPCAPASQDTSIYIIHTNAAKDLLFHKNAVSV